MTYYHGSSIGGIESLRPFVSNHEKSYVYLTHSQVLAAIYAHNPMARPNGWFTYYWGKDGQLHYEEYFDNQTEEIYAGQAGFVYACEGEFETLEKMPWVFLSENKVPVHSCILIPDLYAQLLQYEQEGKLVIHRWKDQSPELKAIHERVLKNSLDSPRPDPAVDKEYRDYVSAHFPSLR